MNLGQGWSSFGVRSALVPVLVVEVLHRSTSWTGIAFTCAAVVQTVAVGPAGRFVDTVGRRPAMMLGTVLAAAVDPRGGLRPEHRSSSSPLLCVYGVAAAFLGHGAGRLGRRRGRGPRRHPGRDLLDVLRRRRHPRPAGGRASSPTTSATPSPSPSGPRCCWSAPSPRPGCRARRRGRPRPRPPERAGGRSMSRPAWTDGLEPGLGRGAPPGRRRRWPAPRPSATPRRPPGGRTCPERARVLRAFSRPLADVRVLVVGQDPYPTPGHPVGLAFSVAPDVRPVPRSLRNVYVELEADLGVPPAEHGDLSAWFEQGVLLLNRVLTVEPGRSGSHRRHGWEQVTAARDRGAGRAGRTARRRALGRRRPQAGPAARRRARGRERPPVAAVGPQRLLRLAPLQPRERRCSRPRAPSRSTGGCPHAPLGSPP